MEALLPGGESAAPNERTVVDASLASSLDELGPAFPDEDGALEEEQPAPGTIELLVVEPSGVQGANASDGDDDEGARPSGAVATRVLDEPAATEGTATSAPVKQNVGPRVLKPHHEPVAQDDAWAELDDRSPGGWHSITGESQVVLSAEPTGQIEESDSESRVFAAGQAVELEEVRARLIGIGGADLGREFPLLEREVSIGRTPGNIIVLQDPSVSREHARLLRDGDRYFLVDQRSGNGTFVNGQRVSRARVRSGDELGFGNVVLRFVETDDVFRPVDGRGAPVFASAGLGLLLRLRASPYGRSIGISLAILTGSLLVAAIIGLARGGGDSKGQARRDVVFQYYLDGVEAFRRRDWNGAENKFSILLGLDPSYERGLRYVEAIGREKRFGEQWQQAVAGRERGDLRQAYVSASQLLDSTYADDAQAMLDAIDAELEGQVVRARAALDAGRPDQALALLTSIELARPGRPDVAALRDRAMQQTAGTSRAQRSGPGDSGGDTERDAGGNDRAARGGTTPVSRAEHAFMQGRLSDALALLRDVNGREARVLQAKLQKFEKAYDAAIEEASSKRADAAIKLLVQARALESKIAAGRSIYDAQIAQRLADMYYVRGMDQLFSSDLAAAYQSFREALKIIPGHDKAVRRISDLEQKAEQLVVEAESLRGRDAAAARERLRTVTQIVAPGRPVYVRAKRQLDALR